MKIKILQVFLGGDGLPYKDQARTVHYPIIGNGFQGASNTTQVKFYFQELGDSNVTWVAVSKLPNGKIGSKVLQTYDDNELGEPYALLELDSFYTQYRGDVFISLQGYQGGVNVTYNAITELYEIHGTPIIQATGSIKFTNNYATQFVGSGEEENVDLQSLSATIGTKLNIASGIVVINNIGGVGIDLSGYTIGQLFYDKTTQLYYEKTATSPYYQLADNGLLGSKNALIRFTGLTGDATLEELYDMVGTNRYCVLNVEGDEYLVVMSSALHIVIYGLLNKELFDFSGDSSDDFATAISVPSIKYVERKNENNKVYGTDNSGNQITIPYDTFVNGQVVRRVDSNSGNIYVGNPTAPNHATSKSYVDGQVNTLNNSINGKVSKVSSPSSKLVYGVDYGNQTTFVVSNNTTWVDQIPQRVSGGHLLVPETPIENTHATSKKYVDDKVAALGTVLNYKGTKTVAQLNALTGQVAGDVYNVSDSGTLTSGSVVVLAGDNVIWTSNNTWDKLAGPIDLSGYATKEELEEKADVTDVYNITEEITEVSLTIQSDGFYNDTGVFQSDTGRRYAIVTGVSQGEKYSLNTYIRSTAIPAIEYFNDNTFLSYEKKGTGVGETLEDYEFVIPENCNKIIVQSADYSQASPELFKITENKEIKFYTKQQSDTKYATKESVEDIDDLIHDTLLTTVHTTNYVDVTLTINHDGFYYTDGSFNDHDFYRAYAIVQNVSVGQKYLLNTKLSSTSISAILYFNGNTFLSYEKTGTGTAEIVTDYQFTIPNNCNKIIVQSADKTVSPTLRQIVETEEYIPNFYTKEEIDETYLSDGYGIKWSLIDNDDEGTRVGKAVGLNATIGIGSTAGQSDFDNLYPWCEMKRCNIKVNANGSKLVIYEGETGFALDGTNGDVYVRIPKFSIIREKRNGYEYRVIGCPGAPIHEAFIENGKVLDEIFIGAFEGYVDNNVLHSISGKIPTANLTGATYLGYARANNAANCSLYDMRCVDALWTLMAVEFGKRNSNRIFGYGYADYFQPIDGQYGFMVYENASNTNSIKVQRNGTYISDGYKAFIPVGSTLTICDTTQENVIGTRVITSVVDGSNYTTITFSGDPITVTTSCFVGSAGCITNFCESCNAPISYHTGRANYIADSDTRNPVRYRWIENFIGSLWHHLPDVTFYNLQPYMCRNMSDYEFGKHDGTDYVAVGDVLIANADNGSKNDDVGVNYWITSLLDDTFAKPLAFGKTYDKSLKSDKAFGAYYYLYQGANPIHIVNGGGFDHLWRCNILTNRAWVTNTDRWYLYGARLIYKNIG